MADAQTLKGSLKIVPKKWRWRLLRARLFLWIVWQRVALGIDKGNTKPLKNQKRLVEKAVTIYRVKANGDLVPAKTREVV